MTGAKTTAYAYNVNGTLNTLTYPDATVLTYGYDARNNVTSITQGTTTVASYTYDAAGNRTGKTLANGVTSTLTYDDVQRLTSITDLTPTPAAGTALQKFEYGYDSMSRRKYVRRDNDKGDVYSYDTSGQVTGVWYDATNPQSASPANPLRTVSYALDAAGNRTGVTDNGTTTSYTPDSSNRYTAVAGKALTYDGRGNLATATNSLNIQQSYAYDAENRLITATNGSTVATFAYDPAGRQVKRVENGTTTYLLHDVSWSLLADYDGSGALTARYVHGAGTDEILTKTDGAGTVLYYHTDGLGSVTKLTNASGAVVEQYQYDIYGAVTISVPNGSGGSTILFGSNQGNRFLFTGREWIASIGLYDYRNRVYSPELGRFLQPDPIGHLGDAYNIYRYCGNDPVNNFDPSGLENWGFSFDMSGGDWGSINMASDYLGSRDPGSYNRTSAAVMESVYGMGGFAFSSIWDTVRLALSSEPMATQAMDEIKGKFSQTANGWAQSIGLNLNSDATNAGFYATMGGSAAMMVLAPRALASEGMEIGTTANALSVPGRVQSRINLVKRIGENGGWEHVVKRHFYGTSNASQFTITENELKVLLQSKEVVGAKITSILQSAEGSRFVRLVNTGRKIGVDKFSGMATDIMTVMTDKYGNLISAFPGALP